MYESFMLDIAGACEIPVTRLFGRSPAGFNATGESDLTNYYDSIEEKQEAYLAPILDKLLPVIALSTWGMVPDDLDYEFNPLRKADPKENADLAKSMTIQHKAFIHIIKPCKGILLTVELIILADDGHA